MREEIGREMSKKSYRTKKIRALEEPFPSDGYVTDEHVASFFGITAKTVWEWTKKGSLPRPIRLTSKATRWNAKEIREFVTVRKVQAIGSAENF